MTSRIVGREKLLGRGSCDVDSCVVYVWCCVYGRDVDVCVNAADWLLVEGVHVLGVEEESLIFL